MSVMNEYNRKPMPPCPKAKCDCFSLNGQGRCKALDDTDFDGKPCPFYKSAAKADADYEAAYDRLVDQGRFDLIQKYHVDSPDTVRGKRGLTHAGC